MIRYKKKIRWIKITIARKLTYFQRSDLIIVSLSFWILLSIETFSSRDLPIYSHSINFFSFFINKYYSIIKSVNSRQFRSLKMIVTPRSQSRDENSFCSVENVCHVLCAPWLARHNSYSSPWNQLGCSFCSKWSQQELRISSSCYRFSARSCASIILDNFSPFFILIVQLAEFMYYFNI